MHHPTDRITHTTAFVTPVVEHWLEREIAQWVHPMKDRSDDPLHHERTLHIPLISYLFPNKLKACVCVRSVNPLILFEGFGECTDEACRVQYFQ